MDMAVPETGNNGLALAMNNRGMSPEFEMNGIAGSNCRDLALLYNDCTVLDWRRSRRRIDSGTFENDLLACILILLLSGR